MRQRLVLSFFFEKLSLLPMTFSLRRVHSIQFLQVANMTRRFELLLFVLGCSSVLCKVKVSETMAPFAIEAMIDGYFAMEIVNFGQKNGRSEATIENLLKLVDVSVPMKVTRPHPDSNEFKLNTSSILLFDSPENFNQTQNRIVFQHGNLISHPHLVYIHNASMDDIQVAANKNHTIDKTMFFVNETHELIELATSFMFSPGVCHKNQFRVINRFTRRQKRWEKSEFYQPKNTNFHGCPIEIPWIKGDFLAEVFNFKIERTLYEVSVIDTATAYVDIITPQEILDVSSYVADIQPRKIYIPPGELYGDFEKMLLPFDTPTWIAIVSLILMGIVTILVIKLKPQEIQEVIFGRNNRSPLMNFFDIVLNGGQQNALVENVPRILLMTFIFWTLIFR
jgi:hypothetical protein